MILYDEHPRLPFLMRNIVMMTMMMTSEVDVR